MSPFSAKSTAPVPAPRRPPARKVPPKVSTAATRFEYRIGGRDRLVAALAHAPRSKDLDYFLGLIGDPRHEGTPLADLCVTGGITLGEIIVLCIEGERSRGQALATAKVSEQLPDVAEDTMRLALGTEQADPWLTLEHKKLALDMGRLLQKGGGVNVAVNQQVGVGVGLAGGSLERLQAATDAILFGGEIDPPSPSVEGEVVEREGAASPDTYVEGDWREDR